jgi:hypothetical protein
MAEVTNKLKDCFVDCEGKSLDCEIDGGVFRAGILGDNSKVSKDTQRVKGWSETREERFITDSRHQNLNDKYRRAKFGDMNY